MEWVDKMDLVLEKLYTESGHAPDMQKLNDWLAKKDIHIGEIQDITLHLYRLKYIYCDIGGNRNASYADNGVFLISCEGKLFWENEKGFKVYFRRLADEKQATIDQSQRIERNEGQLVTWTQNLANRTKSLTNWTRVVGIGAVGLVVWDIIKTIFFAHHSS